MMTLNEGDPSTTGALLPRTQGGHLHRALRSGVGALISLLVLGLGSACGEEVVGWPDEDTLAPAVVATSPADEAGDFALNSAISATFSEAMNPETITAETFTLHDAADQVEGAVTYDGVVATFRPSEPLEADTLYSARIGADAADLAGNTLASDYDWQFTTGTLPDHEAPQVTSTSPERDAIDVAHNASVSATFDKEMDPATISTGTFTIFDDETPVYGEVTHHGMTATFEPEKSFDDETLYRATIGVEARDMAGNPLAEDYSWTFTSGVAPDVTPPTVTYTSPANGDLDAPYNVPLTATFSEAMRSSTISTTAFTIRQGATVLDASVSYVGVTATLTPDEPLEATTTYTAHISADVEDLAGNAMGDDYVWSFTTGAVPDTTPPVITSTAPGSDELDVALNKRITATFSEPMAPLTIDTNSFMLFEGEERIPGAVTYTGRTAMFSPEVSLNPLSTFTVTVSGEVTDLAGNAMGADYTWSFETGHAPDTRRPRVTFTVPTDEDTGVAPNSGIVAVFSETMNAATVTTASFRVMQRDTVIAGTVSYDDLSATFEPSVELEPLTVYSASVTTIATDLAGNALLQDYVWSFRTGMAPDSTRPFIMATYPEGAETDVYRNAAITVQFNEAMDPATISSASFIVEDESEVPVDGTLTMVGSTAVFVPDELLQQTTEYAVLITDEAADLAGNTLEEDYLWMFTTGEQLDTVAPVVVMTSPEDGESDVPLRTSVNASFSEPLNPRTINNVSFEVRGPGDVLVHGTVVYDVHNGIVSFRPERDLLVETLYTAVITTDVTDRAGNPMLADHVWTFTTADLLSGLRPIDFGTLSSFVAAAGAGLTNSNDGGTTTLNGDVALSPTGTCVGDGVPCTVFNPIINGTLYAGDSLGIASRAKEDMRDAYEDAISRDPGVMVTNLSGLTLPPGVYTSGSEMSIDVGSTLILDGEGDSNAVWIFQAGSAITINNDAQVLTINGARAANVFWAAGSSATLGSGVRFQGSVLASEANSVGTGSVVIGRLLCIDGAITLLSNTITLPPK